MLDLFLRGGGAGKKEGGEGERREGKERRYD